MAGRTAGMKQKMGRDRWEGVRSDTPLDIASLKEEAGLRAFLRDKLPCDTSQSHTGSQQIGLSLSPFAFSVYPPRQEAEHESGIVGKDDGPSNRMQHWVHWQYFSS